MVNSNIYSRLKSMIHSIGREKRRCVDNKMKQVAEARAATREEVIKIRDAAVLKIEHELHQLSTRASK